MKVRLAFFSLPLLVLTSISADDKFLVKDGAPKAEIIISDAPTRMQRVAAEEFRKQIEKISGARLPIVTKPTDGPVKIFIGASEHSLVEAEGLKDGAYRIKTGPDWMALVGDDTNFEPTLPFARNNGDIPRAQEEWEKIVGAPYGMPGRTLYKNRLRFPGTTGQPDGTVTATNETLEIWSFDERGSFNAVCGYLRTLGARWYMPGEIGEVLPSMNTIPLPEIDETVTPDFSLRQFNIRFSVVGEDTSMWAMRLGTRDDANIQIAHGMATMTNNEEVFARHPEWFALYGGKRDIKPRSTKCNLCYSDESLFQETLRYVRAQLDNYPLKTVSLMPPDGYTSICQCEKCEGKDSPERHERGLLSNYIWDFTNRVAREIAKSHPDAKLLNGGYGVYTLPPDDIEKIEPNVVVCLVGGRRPINKAGYKGEGETAPAALRAAWAEKTDTPLIIFENYPFTARGWYLPSFAVKSLTDSINAAKKGTMGEDIWLSVASDFATEGIGFNHFLVYFTARSYWGGRNADGDALFEEYCRLFYGPAEKPMHAFFTYCEENWKAMETDEEPANEALSLFEKAKVAADPDSVYGQRLALIDDFLEGLRMKAKQLSQKRGPVPKLRLVGDAYDIVIDGKLDDEYWEKCPVAATGRLHELQTGRTPTFGTTVKAGWYGNGLYFAIRCEEMPGEKPVNAATRDDDTALWHGDAIELHLATETHSYYQIAISPEGQIVDLDRGASKDSQLRWNSTAEVATRIEEDHWTVEIRIPVTQDENDPLHQVIGRKPTQSLPWHINVCRQRVRETGQELSALSPTGTKSFHDAMKFAHFYDGRSHQFEADPEVTDFAIEFSKAVRARKPTPFLALAESQGITDFQKAAALEQAAIYSREGAEAIIEKIPIEAVKKSAQMQLLLSRGEAPELISQFADEDISQWAFWKLGDGHYLRGRAYLIAKDGPKAEADLSESVQWIGDPRKRATVLQTLGQNRERNLSDDDGALEAYNELLGDREGFGGADEFYAAQGIARIQTRRGKFDEALETLHRANPDRLQGSWKESFQKAIEAVKAARP